MDDKITAHERSYLKKCVEADMLRRELIMARLLLDTLASRLEPQWENGLRLWEAARKENEAAGL